MSWTVQKINKKNWPTHPTPGVPGWGGGALGVKISKVREISRTAEKIDKKCNPHPTPPTPWGVVLRANIGGGGYGRKFQSIKF